MNPREISEIGGQEGKIPYNEIFTLIEQYQQKVEDIKAEYQGKIKIANDLVYWGGKIFDEGFQTRNLIEGMLKGFLQNVLKDPRHKLFSIAIDMKEAIKKYDFLKLRSLLEEIKKEE